MEKWQDCNDNTDLRSEGEGDGCAPCAQYNWLTSQRAAISLEEMNQLLSNQIVRAPSRPAVRL